jgi:hypothetical protein
LLKHAEILERNAAIITGVNIGCGLQRVPRRSLRRGSGRRSVIPGARALRPTGASSPRPQEERDRNPL